MTDADEKTIIKSLNGEQLAKELETFNAFYAQFGLRFFDAYALRYHRFLEEEARNREKLQRYAEREKGK